MGRSTARSGVDPAVCAMRARIGLQCLATQLRADVDDLGDQRARTLFGDTASLLLALDDAFAELDSSAITHQRPAAG